MFKILKKLSIRTTTLIAIIVISCVVIGFIVASIVENQKIQASYMEVQKIPVINQPNTFAKQFNPMHYQPTQLKSNDEKNVLYATSFTYYYSPFYPNKIVNFDTLAIEDCYMKDVKEQKELMMDKSWKVFWIKVIPCSREGSTRIYGPFKTTLPIESIYDLDRYDPRIWLDK